MLSLSGHLGGVVTALVDGRLSAEQEERAWAHVLTCPGCREAVEQEAATKRALGALREEPLAPVDWLRRPDALTAWTQVAEVERRGRRRITLVGGVVGGGALTATLAVAAVVGATGASAPVLRPAPSSVVAGLHGAARPSTATPVSSRAAWTGTATGSETSRAARGDRSN